jgi:hypothetical protein
MEPDARSLRSDSYRVNARRKALSDKESEYFEWLSVLPEQFNEVLEKPHALNGLIIQNRKKPERFCQFNNKTIRRDAWSTVKRPADQIDSGDKANE